MGVAYKESFDAMYGLSKNREFDFGGPMALVQAGSQFTLYHVNGRLSRLLYSKIYKSSPIEIMCTYNGLDYTSGEPITDNTGKPVAVVHRSSPPHVSGRPMNYKEKNAQPSLPRAIMHTCIAQSLHPDPTRPTTTTWTVVNSLKGKDSGHPIDTVYSLQNDDTLYVYSPQDFEKV